MKEVVRLTPLESAIDIAVGEEPSAPGLPDSNSSPTPLEALEQVLLTALNRPPCMIDFSGGRDSSILLAVATRVARREGLPLPIPATNIFPGRPDTYESEWQELVVRHLELTEWHRRTIGDEFDLLGPYAQMVMGRHGLVSPSTAYGFLSSFRDAAGGTCVTGLDGDGIFGTWTTWRPWAVLRGGIHPEPRDALRIAKIFAPGPARRAWVRHRSALGVTWLLPEAKAELEHAWRSWWASEPVRWNDRVAWWVRSRLIVVLKQATALLADDTDVRLLHPFLEPAFLAALSRAGGWSGFGDRPAAMRMLFGDLLPREVLERGEKAEFTAVYWTDRAKSFAAEWTGTGVPLDLVDPAALQATWTSERPDARSALLLQAAWLATSDAPEVEQHFNSDLG